MLALHHLDDPAVREQMIGAWTEEREELRAIGLEQEVYGRDLTEAGWYAFERAMPDALQRHDVVWLSRAMDRPEHWQASRLQRVRGGRLSRVRVNRHEAVSRLAIGEFNTAYVRGLARALILRGEHEALVYRAGPAVERRTDCTALEGRAVALQRVLDGHRARYWPAPGSRDALSIPSGPNCHHSIRAMPTAA